jgi:HEAT repeat protein
MPHPDQREGEEMLDVKQLHKDILALANGDDTARRQALQSLRRHGEEEWATAPREATRSLVEALKGHLLQGTTQPFFQKEVVSILGNIGPLSKAAIPQLIKLLNNGVADTIRETAAIALGKIGKEAKAAVGPLVELLATSRPALTAQAVRALGAIGCADGRVNSTLLNLWIPTLQLQGCTAQVAIALCRLHIAAEHLLETLTRTLVTNQEGSLRKAAAEALAWCSKNDGDVVPALLTASLSDTNEEVRQMAQAGLDQMGLSHEKAIDLCARQLSVSSYAEGALRKSGPLAVAALIKALAAKEATIRVQAARTLGCLGEGAAEAVPALTKALQDTDLDVRLSVAKSLWIITKTAVEVVPTLIDLLKVKLTGAGEDSETRRRFLQTVMEALSRIGPPAAAAIKPLTALSKDNNRHIRESALFALQKIVPAGVHKEVVRRPVGRPCKQQGPNGFPIFN